MLFITLAHALEELRKRRSNNSAVKFSELIVEEFFLRIGFEGEAKSCSEMYERKTSDFRPLERWLLSTVLWAFSWVLFTRVFR